MEVLKRLGFILLAGVCAGAVVWTGIKAQDEPDKWTVWFGVASCFLGPAAIASLLYAVRPPQGPLVRRLAAVPEIQDLMEEAETAQEELELIRTERARLVEIVQLESRRQTLLERHSTLIDEARRVVINVRRVDNEIAVAGQQIESSRVEPELQALEEILAAEERGDFIVRFRNSVFALNGMTFGIIPFGGLTLALAQAILDARGVNERPGKRR